MLLITLITHPGFLYYITSIYFRYQQRDFWIISNHPFNVTELRIFESLFIHKLKPPLNSTISAHPLHIFFHISNRRIFLIVLVSLYVYIFSVHLMFILLNVYLFLVYIVLCPLFSISFYILAFIFTKYIFFSFTQLDNYSYIFFLK